MILTTSHGTYADEWGGTLPDVIASSGDTITLHIAPVTLDLVQSWREEGLEGVKFTGALVMRRMWRVEWSISIASMDGSTTDFGCVLFKRGED